MPSARAPAPRSSPSTASAFRVAPGSKHKTGFFLDQRDNRKTLAGFCHGQAHPRPVLQHRRLRRLRQGAGRADEVIGVDLDEKALALAQQNANLNQARIRFVQADLFCLAARRSATGQRFDVVVLDPCQADARPRGGRLGPEALPST